MERDPVLLGAVTTFAKCKQKLLLGRAKAPEPKDLLAPLKR